MGIESSQVRLSPVNGKQVDHIDIERESRTRRHEHRARIEWGSKRREAVVGSVRGCCLLSLVTLYGYGRHTSEMVDATFEKVPV